MNGQKTVYFIFVISCLLFVQSENVPKSKEEGKRLLISDPDLLHSQMESLRRDVQTLTSQLTNLQSSHQSLQSSYQTLQSSYQTQLSKLSSLEDQIKHSQQGRNYVKTYTCNNKHISDFVSILGRRELESYHFYCEILSKYEIQNYLL